MHWIVTADKFHTYDLSTARYRFYLDGVLESESTGYGAQHTFQNVSYASSPIGCPDASLMSVKVDRWFSNTYNHKYKESPPAEEERGGWERTLQVCNVMNNISTSEEY